MCTALISVEPGSPVPVLLLFARDELVERSWKLPGKYWPEHPPLVGGMDLREGGTWLAVNPGDGGDGLGGDEQGDDAAGPRVACLLNGFGTFAPKDRRITRGRLPLAAASGTSISTLDLPRYDPFHLLIANRPGVSMLTWDGEVFLRPRARPRHPPRLEPRA